MVLDTYVRDRVNGKQTASGAWQLDITVEVLSATGESIDTLTDRFMAIKSEQTRKILAQGGKMAEEKEKPSK